MLAHHDELEAERLNDGEPCSELSGWLACLDLADRAQAEPGREREVVLAETLRLALSSESLTEPLIDDPVDDDEAID